MRGSIAACLAIAAVSIAALVYLQEPPARPQVEGAVASRDCVQGSPSEAVVLKQTVVGSAAVLSGVDAQLDGCATTLTFQFAGPAPDTEIGYTDPAAPTHLVVRFGGHPASGDPSGTVVYKGKPTTWFDQKFPSLTSVSYDQTTRGQLVATLFLDQARAFAVTTEGLSNAIRLAF